MRLIHPSLPEDQAVFECDPSSYELVWKRRGWEIAPEPPPEDVDTPPTPAQPALDSPTPSRTPKKENRS